MIDDFGFEVVDGVGGGGIDDHDVLNGGGFLVFVGDFETDLVFAFLEGESGKFDIANAHRAIDKRLGLGLSVDGEFDGLSDFSVAAAREAVLDTLGLGIGVVCVGDACGVGVAIEGGAFE